MSIHITCIIIISIVHIIEANCQGNTTEPHQYISLYLDDAPTSIHTTHLTTSCSQTKLNNDPYHHGKFTQTKCGCEVFGNIECRDKRYVKSTIPSWILLWSIIECNSDMMSILMLKVTLLLMNQKSKLATPKRIKNCQVLPHLPKNDT